MDEKLRAPNGMGRDDVKMKQGAQTNIDVPTS